MAILLVLEATRGTVGSRLSIMVMAILFVFYGLDSARLRLSPGCKG
ncbi:hypothetical protein [Peribacillus sp. CSMR9]|nr:hypothetical protein [Peribacillus sp. CSMR9]